MRLLRTSDTETMRICQSVRNLSELEQSPAELWIILRIFAHAISHCDLDFDLLTLNFNSTLMSVVRLNFVQNLSEIK